MQFHCKIYVLYILFTYCFEFPLKYWNLTLKHILLEWLRLVKFRNEREKKIGLNFTSVNMGMYGAYR